MPRAKKIPPIPFEFKDAVTRLLKVKPEPRQHAAPRKNKIRKKTQSS